MRCCTFQNTCLRVIAVIFRNALTVPIIIWNCGLENSIPNRSPQVKYKGDSSGLLGLEGCRNQSIVKECLQELHCLHPGVWSRTVLLEYAVSFFAFQHRNKLSNDTTVYCTVDACFKKNRADNALLKLVVRHTLLPSVERPTSWFLWVFSDDYIL